MCGWQKTCPERARMSSSPKARLVERALTLLVDCESATPESAASARTAFEQWRTTSPEHERAADEAQKLWRELTGLTEGLKAHFDQVPPSSRTKAAGRHVRQRRTLLLSLASLAGTGLLTAGGLRWYQQQAVFTAAYRTRAGKTLQARLPDGRADEAGSQLDMAPLSTLDVALYRQRREVHLGGGEVRFDVARDPGRPLVVMTRQARIEVLGTVFTVRDRGGPLTVGVEHGHVRVQLHRYVGEVRERVGPAIDLRDGELLEIAHGRAMPARQSDTTAMSAWRDGWLVFENVRLDDALDTINAYRFQPIFSRDPRVLALRLSGRFRSDKSAELMRVLPTILPVESVPHQDGRMELRLR